MNSEHSESYSDPYDKFIEGCIKSEDIYGQKSNNTMDKKDHSPNSGLDNASLNFEIQQNSEQNNNGNAQAAIINSPHHSNNSNAYLSNNINLQIPNELSKENKVLSPFNENFKQPINFEAKNNSNSNNQHQEKYPIKSGNQNIKNSGKF